MTASTCRCLANSKRRNSAELPFGVAAPYWLDLRGYDPVAVAAGLGKPIFILQGGRDYQATVADDLARWARGGPVSGRRQRGGMKPTPSRTAAIVSRASSRARAAPTASSESSSASLASSFSVRSRSGASASTTTSARSFLNVP